MLKTTIRQMIRRCGVDIVRYSNKQPISYPADFRPHEIEIIEAVGPYTLTISYPERIVALIRAVEYIVQADIKGDFVECGVWKGGSMMAVALTLLRLGKTDRMLYLYDTFEGMARPSAVDVSFRGGSAITTFERLKRTDDTSNWTYAPLDEVKKNMAATGYKPDKIVFVKGKVEETLDKTFPDSIGLLRLDTDWYESTLKELVQLYPRISSCGVMIIDDYGHWRGSQKAVDEYFSMNRISILLHRIDFAARLAIKPL
jgi:O-methyltransferase